MPKQGANGAKRGRKRTLAQREADLAIVSAGLKAGKDYFEIAEEISAQRSYSITHWQVKEDAKAIIDRWRASHIWDIEGMKLIELTRINRVEAQAWAAWDRSTQNYQHGSKVAKVLTPRSKDGQKQGQGQVVQETTMQRTGTRVGDPRFLAIIQSCIDQRAKLFSLIPTEPELPAGSTAVGVTVVFGTGKSAEKLTDFPVKKLRDDQVKLLKDHEEGIFVDEPEEE